MEIIKETRAILACPCVFQVLTCATLQHAVMLSSLSIEAQFEGGIQPFTSPKVDV